MDYKEMVCESSSDTEEKFRGIWLQNIQNTACDILLIKLQSAVHCLTLPDSVTCIEPCREQRTSMAASSFQDWTACYAKG